MRDRRLRTAGAFIDGRDATNRPMTDTTHKWQFAARFRRHAFGWRSDTPIQRIKEALTEIRQIARKDPVLAAEGAVNFLEKISAALERVDSSSGAIGSAVNKAIATLVPIINRPEVATPTRERWLNRLWDALQDDQIPYIELLADHWGELCRTPELASKWADQFKPVVEQVWSPQDNGHGHFAGTVACLSALHAAGRHDELLALLDRAPYKIWHYRIWGVKSLTATGRKAEAIRYAEATDGPNQPSVAIAQACEAILLSSGLAESAYDRYALLANQTSTHLATFRAIQKKYPDIAAERILRDLIASTPGQEGKWFAAAKDAAFFDLAIELIRKSPADPRTLTRAAIDFADQRPAFALEVAVAALHWIGEGYGYEITGLEVLQAHSAIVKAATNAALPAEQLDEIMRQLLNERRPHAEFIRSVLGYRPGTIQRR
jgi:hypothetical protein